MRVIGGTSRGRRLSARLPGEVRPTSDRVRESIFDILGSMGGVDGLAVGDLFCGSGGLGLEALSRGAASVTFVDSDRSALDAVQTNLTAVGLDDRRSTLTRGVLPRWLVGDHRFDLALCDPPYAFDDWPGLLRPLRATLVVMESSRPVDVPADWTITKSRRYGGTLVTVAISNRVDLGPSGPDRAGPAGPDRVGPAGPDRVSTLGASGSGS
jgi:16S rRNA (guanine966-N2)-methyltransferase